VKAIRRTWAFPEIDLAAVGVMVLGLVAFYFLTIMPERRHEQLRQERQRQLNAQQNEAAKLTVSSRKAGKDLAEARRELESSPVKLEPAAGINTRIAALTKLASASRLKLEQIQPGDPVSESRFWLVPISLTGSGAYRHWTDFLHCLPRDFPDTEVASFDLSGSPGEPGRATSFRVHLTWYALAPETAPKK
jgi:Tfp pilus assembly protein PilO